MWHEGLTADRSYTGHIIGISFPDCIQQPGVPQARVKTLYQMCVTEGVYGVMACSCFQPTLYMFPLFHAFRCGEFGKVRS